MPGNITVGQNYDIEENSNGDLVIRDSTGSAILIHEDGGNFQLGAGLELGDLIDGGTGDTVYDGSTETLGDGNQDANFNSLSTDTTITNDRFQIPRDTETLSNNEISYTAPFLTVLSEGGANDELDQIAGGQDGDMLLLQPGSENITARHLTGTDGTKRLALSGATDFTLSAKNDKLWLVYQTDTNKWCEVSRSSNS